MLIGAAIDFSKCTIISQQRYLSKSLGTCDKQNSRNQTQSRKEIQMNNRLATISLAVVAMFVVQATTGEYSTTSQYQPVQKWEAAPLKVRSDSVYTWNMSFYANDGSSGRVSMSCDFEDEAYRFETRNDPGVFNTSEIKTQRYGFELADVQFRANVIKFQRYLGDQGWQLFQVDETTHAKYPLATTETTYWYRRAK